jgi:transcriptional regulator with XRE-family HTH domain
MRDDSFAFRLRQARLAARLSQGALAELIDVRSARVSEWETGRVHAGAYEVRLLAKALGVDATWLTGNRRRVVTVAEVIRRG